MTGPLTLHRAVTAALVCCLPVLACDPMSAPLVRTQAGFQVTESGALRIWTGQECDGVMRVSVELEESDDQPETAWTLRSTSREGATLTELTLGEAPAGFRVTAGAATELSWRSMKTVKISTETKNGNTGSYVSVGALLEDAAAHDADEFYVEDEGWLTLDEFTELTEGDEGVAPLCGPGTYAD